ncbi:MAG: hypothetical protein NXI02_21000, partial [Rhodobacteraceae bacterium]|nr:hypothetical protein [Paracoccaceae bacterium]
MKFFSDKTRPVHLGPFPMERLARATGLPDLENVPAFTRMPFQLREDPENIINAMSEGQAMLDAIRDGIVNKARADVPSDPEERSNHLK